MNLKINPSWLIIGSLLLGYIGFYIPGLQVQYQIVKFENGIVSSPTPEKKLLSFWGDKSGRDMPPCDSGAIHWGSNLSYFLYQGYRIVGIGMQIATFCLWYTYAVRKDIGRWKFFFILAVLVWVPIALLIAFAPRQANLCAPSYIFRIVSISPYCPAWLLSVAGLALGYLAYKSISKVDRGIKLN